jgi:hypothetical protein
MDDIHTVKARINQMIQLERDRCRASMGEAAWVLHGAWVTENIVAAAKTWIAIQLKKGLL